MVEINKQFALGDGEGDSRLAQNLYVIAHDTGNDNNKGIGSARNEAAYMKGHWPDAYTHYIVDETGAYQVGEPGYIAYGALSANPYSPVQIELAHVDSAERFKASYQNYISLLAWACKQYGIPQTLDTGGAGTPGVKSHLWVTQNLGGDHQDPYGYLDKWGVSKEQFANDLANGQAGTVNTSQPSQPSKPSSGSGNGFTKEVGTFINGDQPITVHYGPSVNAKVSGKLDPGATINYDGYVLGDGFTWIVYTSFTGDRLYCPVRRTGQEAWGIFK